MAKVDRFGRAAEGAHEIGHESVGLAAQPSDMGVTAFAAQLAGVRSARTSENGHCATTATWSRCHNAGKRRRRAGKQF